MLEVNAGWRQIPFYIFWASTALVLYTYFIYPVILLLLAAFHQMRSDMRYALNTRRERRRRDSAGAVLPRVSMVFAAYNEAAVIGEKMRNCEKLDYPRDRLEILVGCDGCADETVQIAQAANVPEANILDLRPRSGKPSVLNTLVPKATGDIIVFSDANTMYAPDAIRSLVRHFADPKVGCVCGELKLVASDGQPKSEGLYWRYEVFLKFFESRLNMLLGANGGVFAIRRSLFAPLPKHAIIDDFLIGMKVVEQGFRCISDPEAFAFEETAPSVQHEFHRRVRIGAGNFHALRYTWRLLLPTAGPVAFSYWSHKVFRWLVPFALILAFVCSLLLLPGLLYALCALGGIAFALLATVGYKLELRQASRSIFSVPYYFLSMNLALFLGWIRFVTGGQSTVWRRTSRNAKT